MTDKKIFVSGDVLAKARELLLSHFSEHPKFKDNASVKTEETIQKALEGWDRAPSGFMPRIKQLAKLRISPSGDSITNTQAKERKISEQIKALWGKRKNQSDFTKSILDQLDSVEQKHFLEREEFYNTEFEFNESSDSSLLCQLIFEEIYNKRIMVLQAQNPNNVSDYIRALSESNKRVLDLQTALGITRKQRESVQKNDEGNISSIALDLDNKLLLREKELKIEKEKEDYFLAIKASRESEWRGFKTQNTIKDSDIRNVFGGEKDKQPENASAPNAEGSV